jgi:hypothetical protein
LAASRHVLLLELLPELPVLFNPHIVVDQQAITSLLAGFVRDLVVVVKVVVRGLISGAPPIFPIAIQTIGSAYVACAHM